MMMGVVMMMVVAPATHVAGYDAAVVLVMRRARRVVVREGGRD